MLLLLSALDSADPETLGLCGAVVPGWRPDRVTPPAPSEAALSVHQAQSRACWTDLGTAVWQSRAAGSRRFTCVLLQRDVFGQFIVWTSVSLPFP